MKTIRLWLATIATLLCSLTASAHDFEVDGIYYNITSSTDLTVSVTYQGSSSGDYNEYTGTISIPEAVTYNSNTYQVTSIGSSAFRLCNSLSSITIPGCVINIGEYAFEGCIGLKEIIFEDGKETISLSSNYSRKGLFYDCPLETLYLGRTLSYYASEVHGYSPFYNNKATITFVTIGNDVTSIGDYAFYGCNKLSSITIPRSVTSIGNYAFKECSSLKEVVIEDGEEDLSLGYGDYSYWGTGMGLFCHCPLETLHLGRTLSYKAISSDGYSPFYNKATITFVTIGDSVTSIGDYAFYGCCGITSLVIPDAVTSIGSNAFNGCYALTNLTIGSSVSTIGSFAFADCNEIESIYALNTKAITCDESVFATDAYNNAILYVPSDRVFAYEKVTPWNKFQIEPMKKFTVTYMVDGKVYKTIETEYAAEIILPENPTKDGYTFIGWSEVPKTMPANDITIYGSFAINKYLVTFKIGDEVIASDSLEYGASIVIPEAPEKEGYTFNGWGEVAKTVPAGDVTYEGNYSVNSYKLTFIVDGEVVQESSVDYGTTITLPEKPTKEGYSFDGWNEIPETMPASDVTVSGTFTVNKYLVTFRINNEVIASDSLEYGASIVTPEAPEKEGYTFDGWANVPETVPACNLTFEGGYTANEYLLAFIVDGALYEMRKVRCDEIITALDMVEREGYTFVWENWIDKMPAKNYTVRGKYVPNKYAITYVADGEIVVTDSIAYGTAIEALKEPTKEGYTFSGWSEVPETMPAEDVVISGFFTVNIYKVYYYVGDVLVHTGEVAYGESIPEYVYEPTAEGDEFMGWVGETYETMPAHDVTYTANITNDISQCTISNSQLTIYDLNGRKIETDDLRKLEKGIYIVNGKKVMIK